MANDVKIALAVQKVALFGIFFIFLFLVLPLLLEHRLLDCSLLLWLFSLQISGVLLPVQNSLCVAYEFSLGFGFILLALEFLLSIEVPQLGVDLFFSHLLFDSSALVNQLFLTFNLSAVGEEFWIFFSQNVVCSFESLVESAVDFVLTFSFTLGFQILKTLEHFFSDLFRRFQIVIELFFVHTVFSIEKSCKFGFSDLEILSVSGFHLGNPLGDSVLLNKFVCFCFPVSLVC